MYHQCYACGEEQHVSNFSSRQLNKDRYARCGWCVSQNALPLCGRCELDVQPGDDYNLGDGSLRCGECLEQYARPCAACDLWKEWEDFSTNQWMKGSAARCQQCVQDSQARRCTFCCDVFSGAQLVYALSDGRILCGVCLQDQADHCAVCQCLFHSSDFSAKQWQHGSPRKCRSCALMYRCTICDEYKELRDLTQGTGDRPCRACTAQFAVESAKTSSGRRLNLPAIHATTDVVPSEHMRCSNCLAVLHASEFSQTQWTKGDLGRCRGCVSARNAGPYHAPFNLDRYVWPSAVHANFVTATIFARGTFRDVYLLQCSRTAQTLVAKKFRATHPMHTEHWERDVSTQLCAAELARAFTEWHARRVDRRRQVRFPKVAVSYITPLVSTITAVPSGGTSMFVPGEKVLIEPFLGQARWQKHTSNSGWVAKDANDLLTAFSHFTYNYSQGQVVVTDLQGVCCPGRALLTDPVICSARHGMFGMTDLGPHGQSAFFATHRCSDLCDPGWMRVSRPQPLSACAPQPSTSFSYVASNAATSDAKLYVDRLGRIRVSRR